MENSNESQKKPSLFGPTDWSKLQKLKTAPDDEQLPILDVLARNYWTPIFQYLRMTGNDEQRAQELTQDFFEHALTNKLFTKADRSKGKFRNYLLKSLKHYLSNKNRRDTAGIRCPKDGFTSLDQLTELGYFQPKALVERQTPETIFHLIWLREVVRNSLQKFEERCNGNDQKTHFALFRSRVVAPELEGEEPPPLKEQAVKLGLDYKVAENQIQTARRAFLRILENEVRSYTGTKEDALEERQDVLAMFSLEPRL